MPTFIQTLPSQPIQFQAAIAALRAALQGLTTALTAFTTASDIVSWTGPAREQQKKLVERLADTTLRVIATMERAGTATNAGAATMQAQQTALVSTVNSALSGGFVVTPDGRVRLGATHYMQINAARPHGDGFLRAIFQAIAAAYTGQIGATVAQTTMTDAQLAVTLVKLAAELIATMNSDGSTAPAPRVLPGTTAPGTAPPDTRFPSLGQLNAGGVPTPDGTSLAGATGSFSPATAGAAGLSGLGAGAPLSGAATLTAGAAMVGGTGSAGAGVGVRTGGAVVGRGGVGGASMLPVGAAHGAGTGEGREHRTILLDDDADVFATDGSLPDSVVG